MDMISLIFKVVWFLMGTMLLIALGYFIYQQDLEIKLLKRILRLQMFGLEKKENDKDNNI